MAIELNWEIEIKTNCRSTSAICFCWTTAFAIFQSYKANNYPACSPFVVIYGNYFFGFTRGLLWLHGPMVRPAAYGRDCGGRRLLVSAGSWEWQGGSNSISSCARATHFAFVCLLFRLIFRIVLQKNVSIGPSVICRTISMSGLPWFSASSVLPLKSNFSRVARWVGAPFQSGVDWKWRFLHDFSWCKYGVPFTTFHIFSHGTIVSFIILFSDRDSSLNLKKRPLFSERCITRCIESGTEFRSIESGTGTLLPLPTCIQKFLFLFALRAWTQHFL